MIAAAGIGQTVTSGSLVVALPLAAAAGLVSFLSPCVLPLVPGYLSYVTGLTGEDLAEQRRGRLLIGCALFVLGFSIVFMSYGLAFGGLGQWLKEYERPVTIALGSLTVIFGLVFMGLVPGLQRTVKANHWPAVGLAGAPVLGVLFGLGWTPCIGPTLAAIQVLAFTQASATRGAILSFAYCAGLGLPFIAAAFAYRKALGLFGAVKRHYRLVMRIGGGMLVAIGLLLVTGLWGKMITDMQVWISGTGTVL